MPAPARPPEPLPPQDDFPPSAASDCPDLEVTYNHSCVFVLNMQSTFDFTIHPLAEGVRDLHVEVRQSGQLIARETPMVLARRGSPISFGLNYTPRYCQAGRVSFTILVAYRLAGRLKAYAAYRTHTLYSGKEDPRQVCENLVVEVKNNIQQGHAGDMRVEQSFNGLREALRHHDPIEIDREFLALINNRPYWMPLALAECLPDAIHLPTVAQSGAGRGQSLTLHGPEAVRLHLLTQDSVRIGRSRDCEILARILDASGQELREPSRLISQYHALVEWRSGRYQIRDGGQYPGSGWRRSSCGLWVDGRRLAGDGAFHFIAGQEHRITLGDPAVGAAGLYELGARVWLVRDLPAAASGWPGVEPDPDAPAALVLRRLHGPGWSYLLLRTCGCLGWADARCGQSCVALSQGSLHLGDGPLCGSAVPGQTFRAGSLSFQIADRPSAG